MEMESVLREVCANVLTDPTAAKPVLRARAEGLKTLGRIFRATARAAGKPPAIEQLMTGIGAAAAAASAAGNAAAPASDAPPSESPQA